MAELARQGPRTEVSEAIFVSNPADGAWQPAEAWRLVEEVRIGALDGTGPNVFGKVVDVDVDDEGRLFVVDGLAHQVRVFGADGRHIRSIGRAGSGPGEFRHPASVDVRPDGTLWLADLPGNGYSVFDTAGTFIRSYPPRGLQAVPWPGGFDHAGRLYDTDYRLLDDGTPEELLVAYAPGDTLEAVDTILLPYPEMDGIELPRGNSMRMPFGTEPHWHLDPRGYMWVGKDDRYRIVQRTFSGDTVRVIEKDHDPAPVTRADAEAARERLAPRIERIMSSLGGGTTPHLDFPEHRPAYEAFTTDDHGNLWVGLTLIEDRILAPRAPTRYDIFDPEGTYLGAVESPIGISEWGTKPAFRGDYKAGVVKDEMGVDYVVRMRIVRGLRARR